MREEDFKEIDSILEKRSTERMAKHFDQLEEKNGEKIDSIIMLSPSDIGVCRNGGRRGTSYGPQAILSILKKMASHHKEEKFTVGIKSVIDKEKESDFTLLQEDSSKRISSLLSLKSNRVIHLGGGHDHVYPFLKAIEATAKKITVINIDAHLDTRTDKKFHSGTPFRQFANECDRPFRLIQLGIHSFSNSESTFSSLSKGKMEVHSYKDMEDATENFSKSILPYLQKVIQLEEDETVVLSLDCDALDASCMEAVSAVNHNGLPLSTTKEIFSFYNKVSKGQKQYIGLYEYNPLYDNLSQKGARALASLLYPFI